MGRLLSDWEWPDPREERRARARKARELVEAFRAAYPPDQQWRAKYDAAEELGVKPDTIGRYLKYPEGAPGRRPRRRRSGAE